MTQKMDAVNALLDIEVSLILNCFFQCFESILGSNSRSGSGPCNLPQCGSGSSHWRKNVDIYFHLLF